MTIDLAAIRVRLKFEDVGVRAEHFLAMRKALELAPESFGNTPYGITEAERTDAERLLVVLAMHLPLAEFEKVQEADR